MLILTLTLTHPNQRHKRKKKRMREDVPPEKKESSPREKRVVKPMVVYEYVPVSPEQKLASASKNSKKAWALMKDEGPDAERFALAMKDYLDKITVYELFDVDVVAPLVGKSPEMVRRYLYKHADRFPPRYRKYKQGRLHNRYVRVLTAREVLLLRTYTLHGPGRFTQ